MPDGSGSMRALPYRLSVSRERWGACVFIAEIIQTTPQRDQRCSQNLDSRSLAASLMCYALVRASGSIYGQAVVRGPGRLRYRSGSA